MTGTEIIALVAVLIVVAGAIIYIVKSKKSGKRCIGCPEAGRCGKSDCSSCSCGCSSPKAEDSDR